MFAIDFKGRTNLPAVEIPSAVGMRGLYVPDHGEFDWYGWQFAAMLQDGTLRPCSKVRQHATATA